MLKKKFVFIFFFLVLLPFLASALEYPFGGLEENPHPGQYIRALFIWSLGIVGVAAVAFIAIGGFLYLVGKAEQGKEYIFSSLLGLLLLFGSWLILYTINPDLVNLSGPELEMPTGTPPPPLPGPEPSDQATRDRLAQSSNGKITVNKTCTTGASDETCLGGLQEGTVNGVEKMQQECACDIVITGGTESGHETTGTYNHANGYKLDVRPSAGIDGYIHDQTGISSMETDENYQGKDGNVYRYETDHWDTCFGCPCNDCRN